MLKLLWTKKRRWEENFYPSWLCESWQCRRHPVWIMNSRARVFNVCGRNGISKQREMRKNVTIKVVWERIKATTNTGQTMGDERERERKIVARIINVSQRLSRVVFFFSPCAPPPPLFGCVHIQGIKKNTYIYT